MEHLLREQYEEEEKTNSDKEELISHDNRNSAWNLYGIQFLGCVLANWKNGYDDICC